MGVKAKPNIALVQRGVWDMERESMPLASGCLKAMVDIDPVLGGQVDVRIHNFRGGARVLEMARAIFLGREAPDAIGFSVLGWNHNDFAELARLYRAVRPDGWIIFGGNHVSEQAGRVFRVCPEVDVVVNGEGELTFVDLVRALVAGRSPRELHDVAGVSFVDPEGAIVTTPARERIADLDTIPSPLLSGAIGLFGADGRFRYDVVLMETNRGCPYKCSFCYWGGAIGQKLRKYSAERVAAEIDFCGYHQVPDVVLCDANFGMVREDAEFLELLVRAREKYGYPRGFETSWAKNKGKLFYGIVRRMKETGFGSSFTLALQTLEPAALELMGRKNMKLNEWQGLAEWLRDEGLDCYAELIWGVPGETVESFLEGYDRLARYVSRIAVYPHLIMPNTDFSRERERHGFVLVRGERDDFEYVLTHRGLSLEDNQRMHRFLFWARVVAENQILRWVWAPLRELAGMTQSQALLSLDSWFAQQTDSVSRGLIACRDEMADNLDASRVARGIRYFYAEPAIDGRLRDWWRDEVLPRAPAGATDFFDELLRYDLLTRPLLAHGSQAGRRGRGLERVEIAGADYFVRRRVRFRYDVPALVAQIARREPADFAASPREDDLYYKDGFATHIDNHEFVTRYVGKTPEQLEAEQQAPAWSGEPHALTVELEEGSATGLIALRRRPTPDAATTPRVGAD